MEWRQEFNYLLDRKILTRLELGYLFGQIKSIINRETKQLQAEKEELMELLQSIQANSYVVSFPDADAIEQILKVGE